MKRQKDGDDDDKWRWIYIIGVTSRKEYEDVREVGSNKKGFKKLWNKFL